MGCRVDLCPAPTELGAPITLPTYYEYRDRPPTVREVRDADLKPRVSRAADLRSVAHRLRRRRQRRWLSRPVQGRFAAVVTHWMHGQPQAWRAGITHVAIDLSVSHAKAVRAGLPYAVLVAGRFHVIHLANDMVTAVRQIVIPEDQGPRVAGAASPAHRA